MGESVSHPYDGGGEYPPLQLVGGTALQGEEGTGDEVDLTDPRFRQDFLDPALIPPLEPTEQPTPIGLRDDGRVAVFYMGREPDESWVPLVEPRLQERYRLLLNKLLTRRGAEVKLEEFKDLEDAELRRRYAGRVSRTVNRISVEHALWALQGKLGTQVVERTEHGFRLSRNVQVIDERTGATFSELEPLSESLRAVDDQALPQAPEALSAPERTRWEALGRLALAEGPQVKRPESLYGPARFPEESEKYLSKDVLWVTTSLPGDVSLFQTLRERAASRIRKSSKSGGQWEAPWPHIDAQLGSVLADTQDGHNFIIWRDDGVESHGPEARPQIPKVKGYVTLKETADPKIWTPEELDQQRPEGSAVYVSRLISRGGTGANILDMITAYARAQGKKWVRIEVHNHNPELQAYYEGLGFRLKRDYEIDGRPATYIMERPTGNVDPDADPSPIDELYTAYAATSERHNWRFPVIESTSDNSFSGCAYEDTWESLLRKKNNIKGLAFCPSALEGWMQNSQGHTMMQLGYDAVLSAVQYKLLVDRLGLARSFVVMHNVQRPGVDALQLFLHSGAVTPVASRGLYFYPEKAISDKPAYRHAVETMHTVTGQPDAVGPLLEGVMVDERTLEFADGEQITIDDWHVNAFESPEKFIYGPRSVEGLLAGDRVHVRLSRDDEGKTLSATVLVREKNWRRDALDIQRRAKNWRQADEIIDELLDQSALATYEKIQTFYESHPDGDAESRLRAQLTRAGIYVAESFTHKAINTDYLGAPVSWVCDDVIGEIQEADIEAFRTHTLYLRTFEAYPKEYARLIDAMLYRADELGCTDEYVAMHNALRSRWRNDSIEGYNLTETYTRILTKSSAVAAGEDMP